MILSSSVVLKSVLIDIDAYIDVDQHVTDFQNSTSHATHNNTQSYFTYSI